MKNHLHVLKKTQQGTEVNREWRQYHKYLHIYPLSLSHLETIWRLWEEIRVRENMQITHSKVLVPIGGWSLKCAEISKEKATSPAFLSWGFKDTDADLLLMASSVAKEQMTQIAPS